MDCTEWMLGEPCGRTLWFPSSSKVSCLALKPGTLIFWLLACCPVQGIKSGCCSPTADHCTLLGRAAMAQSQFDQFLTEATYRDHQSGSILSRDAF